MENLHQLSELEIRMGFAVLCVEATAKKLGCSYSEIYKRIKRAGLLHQLTTQLDILHTQSKEYVTDAIIETLERIENQAKQKAYVDSLPWSDLHSREAPLSCWA